MERIAKDFLILAGMSYILKTYSKKEKEGLELELDYIQDITDKLYLEYSQDLQYLSIENIVYDYMAIVSDVANKYNIDTLELDNLELDDLELDSYGLELDNSNTIEAIMAHFYKTIK